MFWRSKLTINLSGIQKLACIPIKPEQTLVNIRLNAEGFQADITDNFVVCSLRPLLFFMAWPRSSEIAKNVKVTFLSCEQNNQILAELALSIESKITVGDFFYCVYCIKTHQDKTLNWLHRQWDDWLDRRQQRRRANNPANFSMNHPDLLALYIYYICPRPVVIVSVSDGQRSNLFPMDLIGPTGESGLFSIALRSTSPAISIVEATGKLVFADVPYSQKEIASKLGIHHRLTSIDWDSLGFEVFKSDQLGYNLPAWCGKTHEMNVVSIEIVGSHHVFLCQQIGQSGFSNEAQMHHISGRFLRQRRAKALPPLV